MYIETIVIECPNCGTDFAHTDFDLKYSFPDGGIVCISCHYKIKPKPAMIKEFKEKYSQINKDLVDIDKMLTAEK
jgi:DNA-directed RNA polymerase subunit RPC12/RpoP